MPLASTLNGPLFANAGTRALPLMIKGLCGVIAVFVAIKAAAFAPSDAPSMAFQEQLVRVVAFAALTIWLTFAIGIGRRGHAAIMTLAFAVFVELFLVPAREVGRPGIEMANLGIVIAYSGMQVYWFGLARRKKQCADLNTDSRH